MFGYMRKIKYMNLMIFIFYSSLQVIENLQNQSLWIFISLFDIISRPKKSLFLVDKCLQKFNTRKVLVGYSYGELMEILS
jgi:hypothetical protein